MALKYYLKLELLLKRLKQCNIVTMLKATLEIEDKEGLVKAFKSEEKKFANNRAEYDLEERNGVVLFHVKAKDSVALRSVLNTITKLLSVYDKTNKIMRDNYG